VRRLAARCAPPAARRTWPAGRWPLPSPVLPLASCLRPCSRGAAEPPAVPPGWLGPGLLGACACLPAAADNRRRPRAPARRPVPGRSSRELGAPPPAAAPAPWVPPNPRCGDARYGWALAVASPLQFSELLLKKFWAAEPRAMARVARGVHPPLLWRNAGIERIPRARLARCAASAHGRACREKK